ncbi:MAG: hypothetical protein MZU91_10175 [Desulfosudis oleivorans]|nr:hypothetical protein [Desulfosudis oleivorans]
MFTIDRFDFLTRGHEEIDIAVRTSIPWSERCQVDVCDIHDPMVREIHAAETLRMAGCSDDFHPGLAEIHDIAPPVFSIHLGCGHPPLVSVLRGKRALFRCRVCNPGDPSIDPIRAVNLVHAQESSQVFSLPKTRSFLLIDEKPRLIKKIIIRDVIKVIMGVDHQVYGRFLLQGSERF